MSGWNFEMTQIPLFDLLVDLFSMSKIGIAEICPILPITNLYEILYNKKYNI